MLPHVLVSCESQWSLEPTQQGKTIKKHNTFSLGKCFSHGDLVYRYTGANLLPQSMKWAFQCSLVSKRSKASITHVYPCRPVNDTQSLHALSAKLCKSSQYSNEHTETYMCAGILCTEVPPKSTYVLQSLQTDYTSQSWTVGILQVERHHYFMLPLFTQQPVLTYPCI